MWIRRHPVHSAISAVVILGAAWPIISSISSHIREDSDYALNEKIDAKLKQPIADIGIARSDISQIKGTLDGLIKGIVFDRFAKSARLPQEEFNRKLPDIQNLISLAKQEGVSVDPALVHQVGQKLLNVRPRLPDFWSTSAQLVSYKSSNGASQKIQELASVSLPDCTDSEPKSAAITEVPDPHTFKFKGATYENCRVTLDSKKDDERINSLLNTRFPVLTFKNCLIVYRGGTIELILAWNQHPVTLKVEGHPPMPTVISGNTLAFEDCLLDFTVRGIPPPIGQEVTETLLAQNASTLKLPHP
jgi:hypothetical protein